jgi:hypothetical protein
LLQTEAEHIERSNEEALDGEEAKEPKGEADAGAQHKGKEQLGTSNAGDEQKGPSGKGGYGQAKAKEQEEPWRYRDSSDPGLGGRDGMDGHSLWIAALPGKGMPLFRWSCKISIKGNLEQYVGF